MTADYEVVPGVLIDRSQVKESTYGHKTNGGGVLVVTWLDGKKTVYETATEQDAKRAHMRLELS